MLKDCIVNSLIDWQKGNILIVDDEKEYVDSLEYALSESGYVNVASTTEPRKAVDLCAAQGTDLLLLDWNMPGLDGYSVMQRLKERNFDDPPVILVLTGDNLPSVRQMALDGGARDFVTKPFNLEEFLSRVRNLLEMKLLQSRMRVQNQILEELVKKRTSELYATMTDLVKTRLRVIRQLGLAAEYRDNETGEHIIRMSRLCALLGELYGLDEYQCELLLTASPMHDVGKIGIPDHILRKPGKLNPEELEIMKRHAQIGADLLSGDDSELFVTARTIALTHHEKWNGGGYPHGLAGEEIPLEGRICAVADVFDALTSERPYKRAWSYEEATALLLSEKGEHFDPRLVTLFVENLSRVKHVMRLPIDSHPPSAIGLIQSVTHSECRRKAIEAPVSAIGKAHQKKFIPHS